MSECTVISGGHRLVLERRSSLKYPWVQGVLGLQVPPGELGARGGVRYSRRCPRSAPGAPVLNTLAVGECFFKAAAVILGCLTTQMWWQCHMFLALTLHGVPQFLYVLIFFFFFCWIQLQQLSPWLWLLGSALLLSSPLLLKQIKSVSAPLPSHTLPSKSCNFLG